MTRSLRAPRAAEAGSSRVGRDPDPDADLESDGAADEARGPRPPEGLDRFRIVLAAAMGTVLVSYALLVPPALVVVLAGGGGGSVDGAFAAAIPLWLAAHLIPLDLQGQPLSVLPLLPALLVVAIVSVGARWAVRRLGGRFRHDAGAVVAASAGAHAAVAVLGSALLPSAAEVGAAPWAAMLGAGLVAAIGAGAGVLRACTLPESWRARLQGWPAAGLAGAVVGGAALAFAGSIVLVVGLVFGAGRAHDMFESLTPTGGGALGLTLLCIAYLPNAVVGGAAWLLGPGVDIGLGAWTPFGGAPDAVPPFPLLAALPTVPSPAWAVVVVVVPVGIGLVVGGVCRTALGGATAAERLRAVGVATGVLALGAAVVALAAGGRLSAGDFDPVAMPAGLTVLAVLVWVGGPAAVVALVQRGGPPARSDSADEDLAWYRDGYTEDQPLVEDDEAARDEEASPAADTVEDLEFSGPSGGDDRAGTDGLDSADADAADTEGPAAEEGSEDGDPAAAPAPENDGDGMDSRTGGATSPGRGRRSAAAGPRGHGGRRGDRTAAVDAARRRREARLARGAAAETPRSEAVERPRAEGLSAEGPRAEQSSSDGPRAESTRADQPRAEQSRSRRPRAEQPRPEGRGAEQSNSDGPRAESTRADRPRAEQPRPEHASTEHSSTEQPGPDQPPTARRGLLRRRDPREKTDPPGRTPPAAQETEPAPRTVAELVALRKRQAEAARPAED